MSCHAIVILTLPTNLAVLLFKGPVIIYDRARRKTTFSGKKFCGPLSTRTKKFGAHSTSCDNFLTPTLEKYNR